MKDPLLNLLGFHETKPTPSSFVILNEVKDPLLNFLGFHETKPTPSSFVILNEVKDPLLSTCVGVTPMQSVLNSSLKNPGDTMYDTFKQHLHKKLEDIESAGLYKRERVITSPQQAEVTVAGGSPVLNLCANNYLGLANHPDIVAAAREALDNWGYGLASVRFICGTQSIHKQLEERLSDFLGTDDTILYGSCFDANGGLFETLLEAEDAIISRRAQPRQHHRRHSPL